MIIIKKLNVIENDYVLIMSSAITDNINGQSHYGYAIVKTLCL